MRAASSPRTASRAPRCTRAAYGGGGALLDGRRSQGAERRVGRRSLRSAAPTTTRPGMRVGFSGDMAISVEEVSALVADLSFSSVLVILAVIGVIVVLLPLVAERHRARRPALARDDLLVRSRLLPPFGVTALHSNTRLPRIHHRRQRDQLRRRPAGALRRGAASRRACRINLYARHCRVGRRAPAPSLAALAAGASYAALMRDRVPGVPAVRRHRRHRHGDVVDRCGFVLMPSPARVDRPLAEPRRRAPRPRGS